ncbi:excinuclease ABC subunit UvrC [bacterium]|nr:MAG: excinuclease ABC subunit UvrC [bacterium]
MNNGIGDKIASFPDAPGVYLMKDKDGGIIYIGKANSLRRRVSSYLAGGLSAKNTRMMDAAADIEYRLCPTESMALLLEASLIRRHKPKYNTALRDDKSFPLVKITNEEFPAVYITRKRLDDGARYFGPYLNAGLLKNALKIIRKVFPYRSCKVLPKKACIYYRIKLSPAPCAGKISRQKYARTIKRVSLILEGKTDRLTEELKREMSRKAKEQKFEEAAVLRDKLIALSSFSPEFYTPQEGLSQIKDIAGLKHIPRRIEAFDVSDILGRHATASMVSFHDGLRDKDSYRRFRIKTVEEANDYKMLAEALCRRYQRLKQEQLPLPDLILVDGGKGQLRAGKKALAALDLDIPIISIAKREEEIYTLDRPCSIRLKSNSPGLRMIQRIRDEAHRFALKYHHILRRKKFLNEA